MQLENACRQHFEAEAHTFEPRASRRWLSRRERVAARRTGVLTERSIVSPGRTSSRSAVHSAAATPGMPSSGAAATCQRRSPELADQHGLRAIAFPAISTGVYGLPKERAARSAVREVSACLAARELPKLVTPVACSEDDRTILQTPWPETPRPRDAGRP